MKLLDEYAFIRALMETGECTSMLPGRPWWVGRVYAKVNFVWMEEMSDWASNRTLRVKIQWTRPSPGRLTDYAYSYIGEMQAGGY